MDRSDPAESYLAICDFSGGVSDTGRTEEHLGPLARQAATTVYCIEADDPVDGLTYRESPSIGVRPVDLLLLFATALVDATRNDYDGAVSISLIPYGCFALAIGRLCGLPVHLGIIGADLDVHARARYRGVIEALVRRFDVVSVPGTSHARQLERIGVPSDRIEVLANGVDTSVYRPAPDAPTAYEYVWVGRFSAEKGPLLFVEAIAELERRGAEPRAVMLGTGPLRGDVAERVRTLGLDDRIDLPGWVDEPAAYYRRSAAFVLTSERDALPLTLLEAMATGLACVVPDVGNVRDAVTHGESGLVVTSRDAASFADALGRLRSDRALYDRVTTNAPAVAERFSHERAAADWAAIRTTMRGD